jgi:hypothetical protein
MAFVRYTDAASAFDDVGTAKVADVGLSGARFRISKGNIALLAADLDTGDQIALCPLPTGARIHTIGIQSDNLGTALTADCGLYDTDSARTVIDADAYASSLTIDALAAPSGAITSVRSDFRWESAATDLNTMANRIWEDGGVSADPVTTWLLALTIVTSTTPVAGDLGFIVGWTID